MFSYYRTEFMSYYFDNGSFQMDLHLELLTPVSVHRGGGGGCGCSDGSLSQVGLIDDGSEQ